MVAGQRREVVPAGLDPDAAHLPPLASGPCSRESLSRCGLSSSWSGGSDGTSACSHGVGALAVAWFRAAG